MNQDPTPLPSITPEVLQTLTVKWIDCFVSAARAGDKRGFGELFSSQTIVFGGEKGGCVDWDTAHQLHVDTKNARIHPVLDPPGSLCIADWKSKPLVLGGTTKRGHVTFFFVMVPGSQEGQLKYECIHAHFSQTK